MRCIACNKNLNDFESTRKDSVGNFVDLCNHCYHEVQSDINAEERQDLSEGNNIHEIWQNIKKYFLTIEEWYNDKELYHLIGYLIENDYYIHELKNISYSSDKISFKK